MIYRKIKNRIRKFWYAPIPVFVMHQVSDVFNPLIDRSTDWTHIDVFKRNLSIIKKEYSIISLQEATEKLKRKYPRRKKYAVLTFDDAYHTMQKVLDYLILENIPATVFVNSAYWDKTKFSTVNAETYIKNHQSGSQELISCFEMLRDVTNEDDYLNMVIRICSIDLSEVTSSLYMYKNQIFGYQSPLISFGMHGYEHLRSDLLSDTSFEKNVKCNFLDLKEHPNFIPYFAFPWGAATPKQIRLIHQWHFIPVMCDGILNYNNSQKVSRIPLDNKVLNLK